MFFLCKGGTWKISLILTKVVRKLPEAGTWVQISQYPMRILSLDLEVILMNVINFMTGYSH